MAERTVDAKRTAFYCSTSIENFRHKLKRRFGFEEWHFLRSMYIPAVFFGMYNSVDYFRFLWHRGQRVVFWCGGDILNLQKRKIWQFVLKNTSAKHICENEVEHNALRAMGIESIIYPCLIDRMDDIKVSFKPSKRPHVYTVCHEGRAQEYGILLVQILASVLPDITFHVYGIKQFSWFKNLIYHGLVSNDQFNEETKHFHAALRLNEFDGFSEILARSILLGQYPISRIKYPRIDSITDLPSAIDQLRKLKRKQKPNYKGRTYWHALLCQNKNILLSVLEKSEVH